MGEKQETDGLTNGEVFAQFRSGLPKACRSIVNGRAARRGEQAPDGYLEIVVLTCCNRNRAREGASSPAAGALGFREGPATSFSHVPIDFLRLQTSPAKKPAADGMVTLFEQLGLQPKERRIVAVRLPGCQDLRLDRTSAQRFG